MKNDSLKKLSRIVSLLKLLEDGGFAVNNAAGNLYVSTRTIQRDIRVIEQAGFPIYSPSRGNFAFVEGFSLNKTRLDAKEASLMVFFADMATALGPSFAKSFKGIQQKLLSAEADSPYFIKMPKTKGYPDNNVTNKIAAAITNRKKVLLKYWKDGKLLDYDASPLKIANYEGFWYLLCLNKSGTFRTHRLGKFVYCEPTGQNFTPPKSLNKFLKESINAWAEPKRDKRIVLKISADVAYYFKEKEYFPRQKIIKEWKDGALTIEGIVSNNNEAAHILQQWPSQVIIISPKSLNEYMKKIL